MSLQKEFPLSSTVGQHCSNQKQDIALVQAGLSILQDQTRSPLYKGRVDGICGPKTHAAVEYFFALQNLSGHKSFQPNGQAHKILAQLVKADLDKQPKSQPPYLTFNGKRLCWVGKPYDGKCWEGVSGASGYQSPEYQNLPDKGPIPEGTWRVRQDEYQEYKDVPLVKKLKSAIGGGTWPGGPMTWGRHRVWLHPMDVPNIYGRANFSIHGGNHPGSAGCIDLTFSVSDFAKVFAEYGGDMDLVVKYELR